ncbi:hypothetical protein BGZ94_005617 [Podila epigama]|nr:hypothetical protein BGZ94_005617 [Podila epigama]
MPESTTSNENDKSLYPHSTDFKGRPPPPAGGYSWEDIKSAIESNSLHSLRRTDKGQWEYEVWQNTINREKYGNVGRFIALTILQWPDLLDPVEVLLSSTSCTTTTTTTMTREQLYKTVAPRLTLRLNHYPFPVQESIQYFVLWSTRDMSVIQERERLDQYLQEQFVGLNGDGINNPLSKELLPAKPGKKKEWIWFVNPIELRSVATVHHLHVFVRDVDSS